MARELIEEHLAHNGSTEDEELIKKALGIVYVGKRVMYNTRREGIVDELSYSWC